jgi:hypothetical protein
MTYVSVVCNGFYGCARARTAMSDDIVDFSDEELVLTRDVSDAH